MEITYLGAAFAGLLSFLTPCILPMVPFYLSYMAGLSMQELHGTSAIPRGAQRRLVLSAFAFALGVTTIFVLIGMAAAGVGDIFAQYKQQLGYIAAAVLLIFGLHFLGVIRVPLLYREARMESKADPGTILGAYVTGLAFGFGWTPCAGPAIAAMVVVAGAMGEVWRGGLLMFVYGMAMTAPFVIAAFFARPFLKWMNRHRAKMAYVERIMGVLLIVFAVLIATNSINAIAQWMINITPQWLLDRI